MEKILERYERYSYTSRELVATDPDSQGNISLEYNKLKSKIEALQKSQRHIMGEDIADLSFKELQHLEQQLDTALRQIRSRKNQLTCGSITELQRKGKALEEENNKLRKEVKEKELTLSICEQNHAGNSSPILPSEALPVINTSGANESSMTEGEEDEDIVIVEAQPEPEPQHRTLMPPWMLRHIQGM